MATVEGVDKVTKALKGLAKQYADFPGGKKGSVIVGYTQGYALHVHERLDLQHKEGQQAKYLEAPARENASEVARIVRTVTKRTKSLRKGLIVGGLRIQRESQKVVPVDTGALKGSAFTREE